MKTDNDVFSIQSIVIWVLRESPTQGVQYPMVSAEPHQIQTRVNSLLNSQQNRQLDEQMKQCRTI